MSKLVLTRRLDLKCDDGESSPTAELAGIANRVC